jgi:hypothetical protein
MGVRLANFTPGSLVLLALVPLIAWRLYSRIRRLVGRQHSRPWRHGMAAILFPLLLVLLGFGAWTHPEALAALAAGTLLGAALAAWGLRLTRFERTAQGVFYTPNAHIGVALSVVFAARIAYRVGQMHLAGGPATQAAQGDPASSPLTLLIFGTLAAYYTVYAVGVLGWRARHREGSA